jgi:hypothetical protein
MDMIVPLIIVAVASATAAMFLSLPFGNMASILLPIAVGMVVPVLIVLAEFVKHRADEANAKPLAQEEDISHSLPHHPVS